MNINVKFGSDSFMRQYTEGTTIGQVLNDIDLKSVAGWGDNVRALVSGVEQSPSALAPDGGTVVVETRANTKAN
jgi:hypothetical protein